jgi:DNA-binding response OmpR family regulator
MGAASSHIFLVDDDELIRKSLAFTLAQAGYRISGFESAEDALAQMDRDPPDMVLLDIGLPGMDGLDALRAIRRKATLPVIFVTARRRELEQVLGLELGADDYITKPFDPDVLLARIKAVLRRSLHSEPTGTPDMLLTVGDICVDLPSHTVTVAGVLVDLSPREFELLVVLAREPGHVLGIDQLLRRAWGPDYLGEPQIVYVHVRRLREKLESDPNRPQRLLTVRGVGYKLIDATSFALGSP